MHANSGYGIAMRNLLPRLKARGFEVGMQPNWGYDGGMMELEGIPMFPQGGGFSEYETAMNYIKQGYDFLITLYDQMVLTTLVDLVRKHGIQWVSWCMIDHVHFYPWDFDKFNAACYLVASSKWGLNELRNAGYEAKSTYIPLGVDTNLFKPRVGEGEGEVKKEKLREMLGFPNVDVLIGIAKMNKGDRTAYPYMLEGVKIFRDNNPDLKIGLYLHCDPSAPEGFPLDRITSILGLSDITRVADRYQYKIGYSTNQMVYMYNALDVLLNSTYSESFGLPIVEALACGVPVIGTRCSSITEMLEPVCPELLVDPIATVWAPFPVEYWLPDKYKIADCIEKAIARDPKRDREILSKYARENYDWDLVVVPKWVELLNWLPEYIDKECLEIPSPSKLLLERADKIKVWGNSS
jgi:glycosyltransferase involved in cell wall biosynthesis